MGDWIAIGLLAALLVVFIVYLKHRQRADRATARYTWIGNVMLGLLFIFLGGFHAYLRLLDAYREGVTTLWIAGCVANSWLILWGAWLVVRGLLDRRRARESPGSGTVAFWDRKLAGRWWERHFWHFWHS